MAVSFQKLKVWGGKDNFGVSKGAGESKKGLIKKLVEAMKDNLGELNEEQLAWLEEQTGESFDKPKKKKKKKTVVEEKPAKKKKKKKVKEEPEEPEEVEEEEEEEPEEEEEEEKPTRGVSADVEPKELRAFAKALDIPFKGWKKFEVGDWENLANEIYAKVDNMDEDEKEEIPEELFAWYSTIKGVEEEGTEEEVEEAVATIEIPSKPKLKRFAAAMGVDAKGKSDQDVAAEILEDFKDLDEEDYEELPETLVEWAKSQLGGGEEGEDPEVELPDYDTLKAYAKEVGIKFKDIKKLKDDLQALAEAITDAYDSDDEEEYSEELREFYAALCGGEEGSAAPEEEEESMAGQLAEWLEEAGYDPDDLEDLSEEQMVAQLANDYQDEEERDEIPEDAVAYLKEVRPDLFEQEKKPKKKKKKKK